MDKPDHSPAMTAMRDKAPAALVQPLLTRVELVAGQETQDALATLRAARGATSRSLAAQAFANEVQEGRASYGGMLGRVWKEAKRTLDAVEADDTLTITKRVAALRDLAKLMPMLAKAEATHQARIGGVAVEDMSDSQLERELRHIKKRRSKVG